MLLLLAAVRPRVRASSMRGSGFFFFFLEGELVLLLLFVLYYELYGTTCFLLSLWSTGACRGMSAVCLGFLYDGDSVF
jgi:hypothetical protein